VGLKVTVRLGFGGIARLELDIDGSNGAVSVGLDAMVRTATTAIERVIYWRVYMPVSRIPSFWGAWDDVSESMEVTSS
jgi:hypothetical protein